MHDAAVFDVPSAYTIAFRTWYRLMFRVLAHRAAVLLTVSAFSRASLARSLRVEERRFAIVSEGAEHVLRSAADTGILQRFGLQPSRYVFAVSSANPSKNFALIVRAAKDLARSGCKLVVAGGTNPDVFSTESAAKSADLTHIGYVTDAQLRALYENAACFIYPSLYEGFGLPPLEAMSCGCPAVVSSAASLREVCGDAALYCDPLSPADLIDRVRSVLGDTDLAERMRAKGRARAQAYTWRRSAGEIWAHAVGLRNAGLTGGAPA